MGRSNSDASTTQNTEQLGVDAGVIGGDQISASGNIQLQNIDYFPEEAVQLAEGLFDLTGQSIKQLGTTTQQSLTAVAQRTESAETGQTQLTQNVVPILAVGGLTLAGLFIVMKGLK